MLIKSEDKQRIVNGKPGNSVNVFECFGSLELTEEEEKEWERNSQTIHNAEAEYIKATTYGHGGSIEDRKEEFWRVLNILFDGSNEVPLKIIECIGSKGFVNIIRNAVEEMARIRRKGSDNANKAYFRGKRDVEQS